MNKKGCGKMFGGKNNHDWCCGDFLEEDEITGKGNYYYCPECQEKNQSQGSKRFSKSQVGSLGSGGSVRPGNPPVFANSPNIQTIGDGMNDGVIINPLGKNQSQDVAVAKNDRYQRDSGYGKKSICHPDTQSHPSRRDGSKTDDKENSYENFRSLSSGSDTQTCANCGKTEFDEGQCINCGFYKTPQIPQRKIERGIHGSASLPDLYKAQDKTEETEMSEGIKADANSHTDDVSGFCLSDFIEYCECSEEDCGMTWINTPKVKEFIRLLNNRIIKGISNVPTDISKEAMKNQFENMFIHELDKLAGGNFHD